MPGFDRNSAGRIAKATRWVEDRYRNSAGRGNSATPYGESKLGYLLGDLAARVGRKPGSAMVQPLMYDDVSDSLVDVDDPIPVKNWVAKKITSGTVIEFAFFYGWPWAVGDDCSGTAIGS